MVQIEPVSCDIDAAGSGIGLTIIRDVVAQNGGKAWVESAPGGGARFVISVPASGHAAPSPIEVEKEHVAVG